MGLEAWKNLWTCVFIAASLAFYLVVLIVGVKGMGDVKSMVADIVKERRRK